MARANGRRPLARRWAAAAPAPRGRRLGLEVGQSAQLPVVYILVPALKIRPATQTYTRIDATHYRDESGTFRADLPVDEDGLVLDDPGFWRANPCSMARLRA